MKTGVFVPQESVPQSSGSFAFAQEDISTEGLEMRLPVQDAVEPVPVEPDPDVSEESDTESMASRPMLLIT